MAIWQIAAGDRNHDYTKVFLRFGVILVGPGSEGEYFSNRDAYDLRKWWWPSSLAENLDIGDLVVLKRAHGRDWEIVAVGEITTEYSFENVFCDVMGWEIQHCRRVSWKTPVSQTIIGSLRRGTLYGVNNQQAINEIRKVWTTGNEYSSEPIPVDPDEITDVQLIDSLMVEGLPVQNAEVIVNTIWRLRRVAKWYHSHSSDVGEHEIRTFLIVPLLISLGWAEQKIKIEWNNIDVTLFDTPYSSQSKPHVIIESKRLGDGLQYADEQAMGYAQSYPTCKQLIVSDGIRYKLFQRGENKWKHTAYMNLLTPKRRHPYEPGVGGAVSFFLTLIPNGNLSSSGDANE